MSRTGKRKKRMREKGFTLLELQIGLVILVALAAVCSFLFSSVLKNWASLEDRAAVTIMLDKGMERVNRELRLATQIRSNAQGTEMRFRQGTGSYFIFYFYDPNNTYPVQFNQAAYQVRLAAIPGASIGGNFTYGSGEVILDDFILPPPTSTMSLAGNLARIDMTALKDGERMRTRTQLRPRNL